jgi:hypothetical protein
MCRLAVHTRSDPSRRMPVVHVAAKHMTAAICLQAGIAVVPQRGVFTFYSVFNPEHAMPSHDKDALVGLEFDTLRCRNMVILEDFRFSIKYEKIANRSPVFVEFRAVLCDRRNLICRLQRFWLLKMAQAQAKLQALAMGLHPRLGAARTA